MKQTLLIRASNLTFTLSSYKPILNFKDMKKLITLSLSVFVLNICFAYEWHPIGPSGVKTNKLCIITHNDYDVDAFIIVDTGIFILPEIFSTTAEYYNLPIVDVCSFTNNYPNPDSVIVLINEGSYSDGIYSFHLITHELNLIEYCYRPQFIELWGYPYKFYVGYEGGLLTSNDGLSWETDSTFSQLNCTSISQSTNNVENIIVVTDSPTSNSYLLDEDGQTWHQIFSDFKVLEAFDEYGICRDDGYGGLYELYFTGQTYQWNEEFDSDSLNCIGGSNTGNAFVGWHSSYDDDEGIAEVKYSYFQFKNEGLPNYDINHITTDFNIVGGEVIMCCTDEGAFWLDDTTTEMDELESNQEFSVFPNPAHSSGLLNISLPEMHENIQIQLYNIKGNIEFKTTIGNSTLSQQIHLPDVSAGIYYCWIKSGKEIVVEKLVIR